MIVDEDAREEYECIAGGIDGGLIGSSPTRLSRAPCIIGMTDVWSAWPEAQEREAVPFDLQQAGQGEMIWGDGPPRRSNTLAARLLLA